MKGRAFEIGQAHLCTDFDSRQNNEVRKEGEQSQDGAESSDGTAVRITGSDQTGVDLNVGRQWSFFSITLIVRTTKEMTASLECVYVEKLLKTNRTKFRDKQRIANMLVTPTTIPLVQESCYEFIRKIKH